MSKDRIYECVDKLLDKIYIYLDKEDQKEEYELYDVAVLKQIVSDLKELTTIN